MVLFKDRMGKPLSTTEATVRIFNRIYNYFADFFIFLLQLLCWIPSHHIRRLLLRLAGAKIGKGSSIHMGCQFFSLKNTKIGEDSILGKGIFMDGRAFLKIGSHVDIASDVLIYNN